MDAKSEDKKVAEVIDEERPVKKAKTGDETTTAPGTEEKGPDDDVEDEEEEEEGEGDIDDNVEDDKGNSDAIDGDSKRAVADSVADENTCAVCMEGASEERQILARHNCPQCAPDAWKICDLCDNHMISKSCPVCRSDYAARILYKVQGHPLSSIMDKSQRLSEADIKRVLAKSTFLKKILGIFDVVLFCPSEGVMLFIYPNQKSDEATTDEAKEIKDQQTICVAEIPIAPDMLKDDKFELNNKVWDDLEKHIESGGDCQILAPGAAFKRLFEASRRVGSVLLTPLTPSDFDEAIAGMMTI